MIDTNQVRHARLVLRPVTRRRNAGAISCEVTVAIRDRDVLRVKATADHPFGAINRAMARITGQRSLRLS